MSVVHVVSAIIVTPDSMFNAKSLAYAYQKEAHRAYIDALRNYLMVVCGGISSGKGWNVFMGTWAELEEIYSEVLRVAKKQNDPYALITEIPTQLMGKINNYKLTYTKMDQHLGPVTGVESMSASSVTEALKEFSRKYGPLAAVASIQKYPFEGFTEGFFRKVLSKS